MLDSEGFAASGSDEIGFGLVPSLELGCSKALGIKLFDNFGIGVGAACPRFKHSDKELAARAVLLPDGLSFAVVAFNLPVDVAVGRTADSISLLLQPDFLFNHSCQTSANLGLGLIRQHKLGYFARGVLTPLVLKTKVRQRVL